MKLDLKRARQFKRGILGVTYHNKVEIRDSNEQVNKLLGTLISVSAKSYVSMSPSLQGSQLDSMTRLIDNVLAVKQRNESMLTTIASFGLETHYKVNCDRLQDGKAPIPFEQGLSRRRHPEGKHATKESEGTEALDEPGEEDADGSSVQGLFSQWRMPKLIEFSEESGAITNLGVKDGKVSGLYAPSVLQGPQNLGIRDHLDRTEMRRKEGQIRDLQDKIKQSLLGEAALEKKMNEIQTNDGNLVRKLGASSCFGEVVLLAGAPLEATAGKVSLPIFDEQPVSEVTSRLRELANNVAKSPSPDPADDRAAAGKKRGKDKGKGLPPRDNPAARAESAQLCEVFEHEMQEEYAALYDRVMDNAESLDEAPELAALTQQDLNPKSKGSQPRSVQLHMLLSGDHPNRTLEFYKDAYLTQSIGLVVPLEQADLIDLGICNAHYSFLKLVWTDDESRQVFLIALKNSQKPKWDNILGRTLSSNCLKLDRRLAEIKKEVFKGRRLEYVPDSDIDQFASSVEDTVGGLSFGASAGRAQAGDSVSFDNQLEDSGGEDSQQADEQAKEAGALEVIDEQNEQNSGSEEDSVSRHD